MVLFHASLLISYRMCTEHIASMSVCNVMHCADRTHCTYKQYGNRMRARVCVHAHTHTHTHT